MPTSNCLTCPRLSSLSACNHERARRRDDFADEAAGGRETMQHHLVKNRAALMFGGKQRDVCLGWQPQSCRKRVCLRGHSVEGSWAVEPGIGVFRGRRCPC
jgi:hypothetical protein